VRFLAPALILPFIDSAIPQAVRLRLERVQWQAVTRGLVVVTSQQEITEEHGIIPSLSLESREPGLFLGFFWADFHEHNLTRFGLNEQQVIHQKNLAVVGGRKSVAVD
jgi:hypothetical protein